MENEISSEIEYVVECIQEYMNGNEDYYEVVEVVIKALHEFKKLQIRNTLKAKLIFLVSKFVTFIKCPGLLRERDYQAIIECLNEDFGFYLTAQDKINQYIKKCEKTNHYPDLDMAYILYLNLSFLFRDIISYSSSIRTLEDNYINGYSFYGNTRSKAIIETKETINKLLVITEPKKED